MADDAEGGAVFRGDLGQPIGEPQAAGAFHVLDDDRRIAGNMAADEASHHAPIDVIAAADAGADVERHRLALVEIGRRLRVGRSRQHHQRGKRRDGRDEWSQHGFSSRWMSTDIPQMPRSFSFMLRRFGSPGKPGQPGPSRWSLAQVFDGCRRLPTPAGGARDPDAFTCHSGRVGENQHRRHRLSRCRPSVIFRGRNQCASMIAVAFAASLGLCTVSAGAMPIATLNGGSDAMVTPRRAGMRSRNASRTLWPLPADLFVSVGLDTGPYGLHCFRNR